MVKTRNGELTIEKRVVRKPRTSPNKNPLPHEPELLRLTRDLLESAAHIGQREARLLVDLYYMIQEDRKRAANQLRAMADEPHALVEWFALKFKAIEDEMGKALNNFAGSQEIGAYMMANVGIGPIISAGMMSHIDIEKAPTAGKIWRFSGLDPTTIWLKGQKRPYNARLKTLTWKVGQSFMKLSHDEDCFYGKLYRERKAFEIARNQRGDNIELAKSILEARNISPKTDAYKHLSGIAKPKAPKVDKETGEIIPNLLPDPPEFPHLPPGQIDARSRRWAVKLWISHVQLVWYWMHYKRLPPAPYPIGVQGHASLIVPPYFELVPGLDDAIRDGKWLPYTTPRLATRSG